jgi:anti-sigma factor RsiW
MENVTRDVIADLYPLYVSGDASPDTRRLIEAFLSQDPEFAQSLRETGRDSLAAYPPPPLPPDHELKTLARLKRRLSGPLWLMNLAMILSGLAFGRIVADTSWDVSPRNFIVTAIIAICFWGAFFIRLFRGRRSVLVRLR